MSIERREIKSREEWLEWRKQDYTASNIGALFDCHPYTTALRMFAEKRGTEFLFEDNKVLRRGRWLEPAISKAVEELRPEWKLIPPNEYLRDPDLRLGATPDFYIEGDQRGRGICQTKSVAPSVYQRDWNDGAEVPLWIVLQATVEAMLANADFAVVAALLIDPHNMDCVIHELPRNQQAEDKIKQAVFRFWQDVENGIEPEPDFEKDADVIKAIWKRESEPPVEIDLSVDNRIPALLEERAALKSAEKMAHDRIESINTQLIYAMKDAAVATGLDGWRITYKTTHFKEYTVAARDSRVLRVTDKREKQS